MKQIKNEKGQALIELIVFLPLMFMVYSLVAGFASAINGSINQQKITRAYFYYRVQGNSTLPAPSPGNHESWSRFGMFFIGWSEKLLQGTQPVMTCYKINLPLGQSDDNSCDESYEEDSSQFIRVGTVYGVCGNSYGTESGAVLWLPNSLSGPANNYVQVTERDSCLIY